MSCWPRRAAGVPRMFGQSDSNDYQPFGYLGRIPLYLTTILVLTYCTCAVGLILCKAANGPDVGAMLYYDSAAVRWQFQFWRFFTYPLVDWVSLWFVVEMYLLYNFGREVERFIGRASLGMLYGCLVVLSPCIVTAVATVAPPKLPILLAGSGDVNFAVFIAFCTIYPNVEILFTIRAKWIAAVLIAVLSLQYLGDHQTLLLSLFWANCLAAFLFIKYLRGQIQFSLRNYLRLRRSRRSLRPLPGPRQALPGKATDDLIESIDPLLDKIAKHGIGSLTPGEREKLEEARAALLKKPML